MVVHYRYYPGEHFPHRFDADATHLDEITAIEDWCRETFGDDPHKLRWVKSAAWQETRADASAQDVDLAVGFFHLRNEADADLFKARWC